MTKFLSLFIFFLAFGTLQSHAQFSRYIIRLKNKTGTPFTISNPSQFLTQRSINRRTRYNIPIDTTDLPIPPSYLDSIRQAGTVTILNVSKWLNQVCISTTDNAALTRINNFSFVQSTSGIAARVNNNGDAQRPVNKFLLESIESPAAPAAVQNTNDFYGYGSSYNQVRIHNGEFLHNYGFRGQGMQMCITDAGFLNYLSLPTFDSVRNNGQILGTWDFVANNSSVNEDDSHGMRCFSTIAANIPGTFTGTAPAASFYLYRTEDVFSEYPVEEQNWAAAAERGDSLGIDVFSISLGYTTYDNSSLSYNYSTDMTGNKTMITRAVNLAAKKGILVVAAAGNDGNDSWRYIATPADADSALTVGAININRQPASFSSYGPNADGQIKPDVAAVGAGVVVASSSTGQPSFSNGTSFACPIMAGIGACLWQAFPEVKNMDIIQGLRQSADRFATPDDRTGYGIPDAKRAFVNFIKQLRTLNSYMDECTAVLNYKVKASSEMNILFERKLPSDADYVIVNTQTFTGAFSTRTFSYTDGLGEYTSGVPVKYRIKMTIGTDTSFYLDSVSLAYVVQCNQITERKICPNTSTYLSADSITGYTAKWQVDSGSGFTDIVNNSIYSGAGTRVLLLNNIPADFYGYQYRSVQTNGSNTINSTPIELKFTSTWTGTSSNAWEDAGNWSCGIVPNQFIDAVITEQAPAFPVVSSNASCHSLISSPGASVTVKAGFNLDVTGR